MPNYEKLSPEISERIKEDIAKLAAVNEAPSYTVNGSENEQ